jgi:hypothetical protein
MRRSRTWLAFMCVAVATALVPGTALGSTPRYRVTAYLPSTNVAGQPMRVHGRVWPHAAGTRVRIQVREPGASSYRTLRTARVHSDGRYHAWIKATVTGLNRYRVVEPAGQGRRRGVSEVERVTVSQWRTIASLPKAQGQARRGTITPVASANLNGTTFAPALDQTTDPLMHMGLVVYDVGRRCTRLTTWVGAAPAEPDQAPTNATAYIDTGAYDAQALEPVATAGASPFALHPVQLTVGPARLASADLLALQVVQGNAEQFTLEWGRPMILCSF